ncbi:MAG TPA: outer membrane beta-barrel protein [Terriglobales bacterium]|nr:outer membrane beta-barrel protein [Terriglobales bacterium]
MARNWFVVTVVFSLVLLAVGAAAQKNDVSASVGRVFISDQGVSGTNLADSNIHFGDALSYSLSYGRRISDLGIASLTVEVPFVHDPGLDLHYSGMTEPKSYSAIFLAPSLRVNFLSSTAFSPWVSGGIGFAHFSSSSQLENGGTTPGDLSVTSKAVQLGLGLDVRFFGNLKIRGEVRDFYTDEPNLVLNPQKNMHNYFAGAGFVWSF